LPFIRKGHPLAVSFHHPITLDYLARGSKRKNFAFTNHHRLAFQNLSKPDLWRLEKYFLGFAVNSSRSWIRNLHNRIADQDFQFHNLNLPYQAYLLTAKEKHTFQRNKAKMPKSVLLTNLELN